MTHKERVERMKALYAQAREAATEGNPESLQRAENLMKEADDLKAQVTRELDILKGIESSEALLAGHENASRLASQPETKQKFDSFDEWMGAVSGFYTKARLDPRLRIWSELGDGALPLFNEQKQMVENVGASGGFLVPVEVSSSIMSIAAEGSIVRPRAEVIRMTRRQYDRVVLDQTGTTANVPHWFGGMVAYWGEEAAEKTISSAKWRTVSLVAKKLYGYTRASDELADDAVISLNDFLASEQGLAGLIAWNEDYAFLQGNGTTQPLGVINAGATITVARQQAGPGVDPVTYEDLTAMLEAHLESPESVWVASISLKNVLMNMTYPSGYPTPVWQPNAREGMPDMLLGRPLIWTEKVPLAGNAGDLGLYNFRHYLLGDRQATTIASTNAEYFKYDQISWRAVHRVDGRPWLSTPFTLQDGTTQISPFVILGAKTT